ncbi:MAG TPA: MOSC N-terminal beta barrel domain-containing protein [Puia sp.]|nr:MOSC N-terminal beta barrel domain-containing protein [Puia sp.]
MLTVSELYIYPVKSLGGISIASAALTDRGFEHDRRWMLVDENNRCLTQRELPRMALLQTELTRQGLTIRHKHHDHPSLPIPFGDMGEPCTVTVFEDVCSARWVNGRADEWFSQMLSFPCRLVYMPDSSRRLVDDRFAHGQEVTSFSDAFPLLVIGQASLDDLNKRLPAPLPMDRFRPNIVFTGGKPYQEDSMEHFRISGISFFGVKLCARCVITTTDQFTAEKGKEPLQTLNGYRKRENKILFGQNLLYKGKGSISVNDELLLSP